MQKGIQNQWKSNPKGSKRVPKGMRNYVTMYQKSIKFQKKQRKFIKNKSLEPGPEKTKNGHGVYTWALIITVLGIVHDVRLLELNIAMFVVSLRRVSLCCVDSSACPKMARNKKKTRKTTAQQKELDELIWRAYWLYTVDLCVNTSVLKQPVIKGDFLGLFASFTASRTHHNW